MSKDVFLVQAWADQKRSESWFRQAHGLGIQEFFSSLDCSGDTKMWAFVSFVIEQTFFLSPPIHRPWLPFVVILTRNLVRATIKV